MLTNIVNSIYEVDSIDDLDAISSAIRSRKDELYNRMKNTFKVGQQVWFLSKTRREKVFGVISKINKKNVQVVVDKYSTCNVHPSFLHRDC